MCTPHCTAFNSPLVLQEGAKPEASPAGEGAGLAQETFRRYREGMMEAGDCANGSVRVGTREAAANDNGHWAQARSSSGQHPGLSDLTYGNPAHMRAIVLCAQPAVA